jgi:chaperone BCS1
LARHAPAPAAAPAPDRGTASDLIAALRDRAPRLALGIAAAQIAWPATGRIRGAYRERTTYTVKVPGTDEMYDELHEWVLGLLPDGEQRALVAWSSRRGEISRPGERPAVPPLRLRYDGEREQVITVGGHRVRVVVSDGEGDDEHGRWKPPQIIFTARSLAGRQALLAEIGGVLARSHKARARPVFRMLGKWGDWDRLDDLPPRSPDSVILPEGQMERLIADVARFLAGEADYARRCVPWHRGHLYEGPPGTGKTSVARAVASHFGMDVWYLPLADVRKDGELLRLAGRVSPRSMLLLEDVDVFHAATQRDDDSEVTLSGLLNALDGIATPHGLLTVLTTNSPEVLDHAVIRPGRIDLVEHFGYAGAEQVSRLMSRWYGQPVAAAGISGIAPANVVEACKRHDDPAGALAELLSAADRAGAVA